MRSSSPPPHWLEAVAVDAGIAFWMATPDFRRFEHLSPGFEAITGLPLDSLLEDATPFFGSIVEEDRDGFLDGDLKPAPERWAEPGLWEFRFRRADGELRWFRIHGGPVRDPDGSIRGYGGLVGDITAEKESTAAHRRSEEELAAVFRALPDLVMVMNDQGRYLRIASGDREQLYRPESELTGRTLHEVFPKETADSFLRMVREALSTQDSVSFRYPLEIADRSEWFDAILVPMGPDRVLWVARTVTDRVELEHQLAHASKLDALGQLAGGIAHDFNNVITVIQGNTSLLAEGIEDPGLLADLGDIRQAVDRASSLTRQLLAFSRQQVLKPRRILVQDVLDPMTRMLGRIIGEGIDLRIEVSGSPHPILMDPGQLEQVVANLVVNARHAIEGDGQIRIEVLEEVLDEAADAVHAGALKPGRYVCLAVIDSGRGMTREVLERAFDPFFTTKPAGEGTGLGLSMVYGTVRQSGGHIEIDSEPGQGTRIRILFPCVAGEDVIEETKEPEEEAPGRPADILVVEDEEPVRQVIRRFLEGAGFRVYEASNGQEALELVQRMAQLDLVLSDLVMPRMGGGELTRRIREARPDLPVILISGYTGREGAAVDAATADAFLSKPFNRVQLVRTVRSLLNGPGGSPQV